MLYESLASPQSGYYLQQIVCESELPYDVDRLQRAWQWLSARHDVLRSQVLWRHDPPSQQVLDAAVCPLTLIRRAPQDPMNAAAFLAHFLAEDRTRGFDFDVGPAWRVRVLTLDKNRHALVWTFHHLLLDGRSHLQILDELFQRYDEIEAATKPLRPRPFSDYIHWVADQDWHACEAFWRRQLDAWRPQPRRLQLPAAASNQQAYGQCTAQLGLAETARVAARAQAAGVSLNALVQGAWALALGVLTARNDVMFGTTRAGRHWDGALSASMVGCFINTVPFRVHIDPSLSIDRWLAALSQQQKDLRPHEYVPLQQLRLWAGVAGDVDLFDTVLVFENRPLQEHFAHRDGAWRQRKLRLYQRTPQFSCAVEAGSSLNLTLEYAPCLHPPERAQSLLNLLREFLLALADKHFQRLGDLPQLQPPIGDKPCHQPGALAAELPELSAAVCAGPVLGRNYAPISELVAARAEQMPEATALVAGERLVSYAELLAQAQHLARRLLQAGAQPEEPVLVLEQRSPEAVIACLGVMLAAGSFVPVDAAAPEQRLALIAQDCGARFAVSASRNRQRLTALPMLETLTLDLHAALPRPADLAEFPSVAAHQRAYVLYTSGSSGRPKGVEVEHGSLSNLLHYHCHRLQLSARDRAPLLASIGFDASLAEIWPYLSVGAQLHIPADQLLLDPGGLIRWLHDQAITVACVSTAMAESLFAQSWPEAMALRILMTGGDSLRRHPPAGFPCPLINIYGPTEATVDTLWATVPAGEQRGRPAIGRPIANVRVYVVDSHWHTVAPGSPGELLIAGAGLARAYLGQAELSAQHFLLPPASSGITERVYRSGDRVRQREDGEYEFLGRLDDQLQMGGIRIEPGEIECALLGLPQVTDCCVIPLMENGAVAALAAYVAGPSGDDLRRRLSAQLAKRLPSAVIPSSFTVLPSLPRNLSGKVDRQALPPPSQIEPLAQTSEARPRSQLESDLARIWQELLRVKDIGLDDNFFDLGGHSLLVLRLLARLESELGCHASAVQLLRQPSIRAFCASLQGGHSDTLPACLVGMKTSGSKRPIFCVAGAGGGSHWFRPLVQHFDPHRPFYVCEFLGLPQQLNESGSVEDIAQAFRAAIMQVQPEGPYLIGGFSVGGTFAWEIVRQFQQQGQAVSLLFLLDSYGPGIRLSFWPRLLRYLRNLWALDARQWHAYCLEKGQWMASLLRQRLAPPEARERAAQHQSIVQAHTAAAARYRPESLAGALDIFRSQRPLRSAPPDPNAGWGGYAQGGIRLHVVPGDHFSMFTPPNDRIFMRTLNRCVSAAEEDVV